MKNATDLQLVEEFLTDNLWFLEMDSGIRIRGCSIKVEPSGFLVVLKGKSAEGPVVAFMGKSSLNKVVAALRTEAGRNALRWRQDKFAFDNLEKNG